MLVCVCKNRDAGGPSPGITVFALLGFGMEDGAGGLGVGGVDVHEVLDWGDRRALFRQGQVD